MGKRHPLPLSRDRAEFRGGRRPPQAASLFPAIFRPALAVRKTRRKRFGLTTVPYPRYKIATPRPAPRKNTVFNTRFSCPRPHPRPPPHLRVNSRNCLPGRHTRSCPSAEAFAPRRILDAVCDRTRGRLFSRPTEKRHAPKAKSRRGPPSPSGPICHALRVNADPRRSFGNDLPPPPVAPPGASAAPFLLSFLVLISFEGPWPIPAFRPSKFTRPFSQAVLKKTLPLRLPPTLSPFAAFSRRSCAASHSSFSWPCGPVFPFALHILIRGCSPLCSPPLFSTNDV